MSTQTIRDPNNEDLKAELITRLAPNIAMIRALYDLAIDIGTTSASPTNNVHDSLIALLFCPRRDNLCGASPDLQSEMCAATSTKKAAGFLMEKIASLVEFAVSFDGLKTKTPDIQNDLSHFRRFIAVNAAISNQLESLTDAPLNAMSFFVADHCPMLKVLVRAIEIAMTKEPAAVDVSAVLANSRCSSLTGSRPKDGRPMMNYLRAMTGAIILYDHTAVHGAFSSKSEVKSDDAARGGHRRRRGRRRGHPHGAARLPWRPGGGHHHGLRQRGRAPGQPQRGPAAGRANTPVYSGASKAIIGSVSDEKWEGHGPDGLGGQSGKVEASLTSARRNEAVHALIDLAHKYSGELVIAAVGPLTNIALAIMLDPDFMSNVKQLVVMGGLSRGQGNHTPHAEFNVSCDPEATDIVYQHCSAKKLYVVPFETCVDNSLPWETFDHIFHEEVNAHGDYIKKIWKFTRSFCKHEGFLPCDAYAIAILLHPEYIKTAPALKGRIHLAPDEKRGACVWDYDSPPDKANVTLVTEIDTRVFVALLHHLAA
ncbi:hypothetical protein ON010_g1702 [Phytophthora cinnamomi]|nr:hypothetical protein ON010_g1702 [Phytophthora cinnamomi]